MFEAIERVIDTVEDDHDDLYSLIETARAELVNALGLVKAAQCLTKALEKVEPKL